MSLRSQIDIRKKRHPPQVGMYSRKEYLLQELRKRNVKLVTPQIFFDYWERQEPLPRCQDVPAEYFLNIDNLSGAQTEKLEVIAVSYCWIDLSHPDPQSYHLRTLCGSLEKFVAGTTFSGKIYSRNGVEFNAVGWKEVCGSGDGRPVGFFLDWVSVPPQPRDDADDRVFERALRSMNLWYAHSATTTWMLTSLPSGVTRADYGDSGWTTFERQVAGLISPSVQLLEIGSDVREKLCAGSFQNDDYYQISLNTMDTVRNAPVNPKLFAIEARKKHFTNGADCENVVLPRYEETFRIVMAEATQIDYRGLQVDKEKFRDIMAVFQLHSNVERIESIDFSLTGLRVSFEDVASLAKAFVNLKTLLLEGIKISGSLSSLENLQNLTELFVRRSQVWGSTEELAKLEKLTALRFSRTRIAGSTEDVVKLINLKDLSFYNTPITGSTQDLANMENLEHLGFGKSQVAGSTEDLAKLRKLTSLYFSNTQVAGSTGDLAKLNNLKVLVFQNTRITGTTEDLAKLNNLEVLDFHNTSITGTTEYLATLENLKVLVFQNTPITGTTEDLAKLDNLERLSFAATQVAGTTGDLGKLSHLKYLDFSDTQVTGSEKDLATLPLETLLCHGTLARQADLASMTS